MRISSSSILALTVAAPAMLLAGCASTTDHALSPQTTTGAAADDADADARVAIPATELRDELLALEADDQRYERMVIDRTPEVDEPGFFDRKARLQVERAARCREIFDAVGFPGFDMVGEKASHAFWLLVQHADHDPAFQEAVATAMAEAVRQGNADGEQLAYLTDRVRVNTGRPQLYGTQVDHDFETARVFPKRLEVPAKVDDRRRAVGMEPLWEYVNSHCELYFMMNEKLFAERGITEPYRYEPSFTDW